jgi:DNA (cytosine-5)-methyltransferase 1
MCLNAGAMGRRDAETETLIPTTGAVFDVAHALRGEGFDASEEGTGRGTPLVPVALPTLRCIECGEEFQDKHGQSIGGLAPFECPRCGEEDHLEVIAFPERMSATQYASTPNLSPALCSVNPTAVAFDTTQITSAANYSNPQPGDPCHPLAATAHVPAIAIQAGALRENPASGPDGVGVQEGISYTLEARSEVQAVAFDLRGREGGAMPEGPHDTANVRAASGGSSRSYVAETWAVRRLTPLETERLQGFPDNWTQVPYRGKAAADGPRYKAVGNSMACNVMRFIGERIAAVDALADQEGL